MITDLISSNNEFWVNTIKFTQNIMNSNIKKYCLDVFTLQKSLLDKKLHLESVSFYLDNFYYLKGEYLISASNIGFLTNYRLIYEFKKIIYSIPIVSVTDWKIYTKIIVNNSTYGKMSVKKMSLFSSNTTQKIEHEIDIWFDENLFNKLVIENENLNFEKPQFDILINDKFIIRKMYNEMSFIETVHFIDEYREKQATTKSKYRKYLYWGAAVILLYWMFNSGSNNTTSSRPKQKRLCQWCNKIDLDEYGSYECIPLVERKTSYENFRSSPDGIYCQACMIGWRICR